MKHLKTFESHCNLISDKLRIDMIEEFLEKVKDNKEYNIEEPEYDALLDKWDGYEWQTYIQNDLKNNRIIFWEGWVDECWDAVYRNIEKYKNLNKTEILNEFFENRLPLIANNLNLEIIDTEYFWYETIYDEGVDDGYIMKIIFGI